MIRKTFFINKYDYGKNVVDLNEYVISFGTNCNLGCEYCYLKFSKTPTIPVIYKNYQKLEEEAKVLFSNSDRELFYFNLGETTDSLLTEKHFEFLQKIIEIISFLAKKYKKFCYIELRTKTNNILKLNKNLFFENMKLIYASSLSLNETIKKFEHNTATLNQRIESLKFAESLGFYLAIRLEPIIIYPVYGIKYEDIIFSVENIIEKYKSLIKLVLETINLKKIHSITMSTLRLTKKQFKILKERKSKLCFFEMFLCQDAKFRYSRPIRTTIYNKIIEFIKSTNDEILKKTLLSFEFDYIWQDCNLKIKKLTDVKDETQNC